MKKIIMSSLAFAILVTSQQGIALTALADQELAAVEGQALLNMQTNYDSGQGIKFHKLGLEALMELNVNIKSLQLGCGGMNGANACDIDISNISLSGPATGQKTDGSPSFTGERAATSAQITNPFIEFAISGNQTATREVVGFRLGAEEILGLLTLGTDNIPDPKDGIKSFSGYMKMAQTEGHSYTKAATFGNASDQKISGTLTALGQDRTYTSKPGAEGHTGITVPSMRADFVMPETVVTGKRLNSAVVSGIRSTLTSIPLAASESGSYGPDVNGTPDFSKDQLYVTFPALISLGSIEVGDHSFFKMAKGSTLENLNMDITFVQALNMIHNIPLSGTGGYLSLQSRDVQWLGADDKDIAKAGWWMSFKDPIDLGYLETKDLVDVSAVLPQVAKALTTELMASYHNVDVSVIEALGSLAGTPIERKMNINVGAYTGYYTGQPARLTLQNQVLQNQSVTSNCFGGHKFC
ncbi:hypothetical protein [Acinetobacter schindleri]|uniref:Uncharacterized protein n=1 Tax=Acinetobacter schindleri TaxID=108981 RepID=A0AAE6WUD4_9GAMM|nr:hypothetical protein [Acinetobacter schindleri]QIC66526.1 hypothetical protein FSC10_03715 [Acinetobacter schindleri]